MMRLAIMALALVGCSANACDHPANGNVEASQDDSARLEHARKILAVYEAALTAPGVASASIGGVVRLDGRDIRPIAIVENSVCPTVFEGHVACDTGGRLRLKVSISGVPGEPVLQMHHAFALPDGNAVTLVVIAPPNILSPPPGLDLSRPPRFGFRSSQPRDGK